MSNIAINEIPVDLFLKYFNSTNVNTMDYTPEYENEKIKGYIFSLFEDDDINPFATLIVPSYKITVNDILYNFAGRNYQNEYTKSLDITSIDSEFIVPFLGDSIKFTSNTSTIDKTNKTYIRTSYYPDNIYFYTIYKNIQYNFHLYKEQKAYYIHLYLSSSSSDKIIYLFKDNNIAAITYRTGTALKYPLQLYEAPYNNQYINTYSPYTIFKINSSGNEQVTTLTIKDTTTTKNDINYPKIPTESSEINLFLVANSADKYSLESIDSKDATIIQKSDLTLTKSDSLYQNKYVQYILSSSGTDYYIVIENYQAKIQVADANGNLLYLDKNGNETVLSSVQTNFAKHSSAIRQSFYKFGELKNSFISKFNPYTRIVINKGDQYYFSYYERYKKTTTFYKAIEGKFDDSSTVNDCLIANNNNYNNIKVKFTDSPVYDKIISSKLTDKINDSSDLSCKSDNELKDVYVESSTSIDLSNLPTVDGYRELSSASSSTINFTLANSNDIQTLSSLSNDKRFILNAKNRYISFVDKNSKTSYPLDFDNIFSTKFGLSVLAHLTTSNLQTVSFSVFSVDTEPYILIKLTVTNNINDLTSMTLYVGDAAYQFCKVGSTMCIFINSKEYKVYTAEEMKANIAGGFEFSSTESTNNSSLYSTTEYYIKYPVAVIKENESSKYLLSYQGKNLSYSRVISTASTTYTLSSSTPKIKKYNNPSYRRVNNLNIESDTGESISVDAVPKTTQTNTPSTVKISAAPILSSDVYGNIFKAGAYSYPTDNISSISDVLIKDGEYPDGYKDISSTDESLIYYKSYRDVLDVSSFYIEKTEYNLIDGNNNLITSLYSSNITNKFANTDFDISTTIDYILRTAKNKSYYLIDNYTKLRGETVPENVLYNKEKDAYYNINKEYFDSESPLYNTTGMSLLSDSLYRMRVYAGGLYYYISNDTSIGNEELSSPKSYIDNDSLYTLKLKSNANVTTAGSKIYTGNGSLTISGPAETSKQGPHLRLLNYKTYPTNNQLETYLELNNQNSNLLNSYDSSLSKTITNETTTEKSSLTKKIFLFKDNLKQVIISNALSLFFENANISTIQNNYKTYISDKLENYSGDIFIPSTTQYLSDKMVYLSNIEDKIADTDVIYDSTTKKAIDSRLSEILESLMTIKTSINWEVI